MPWTKLEKPLVSLIALHSYAVGLMLLVFPDWSVHLGGWPDAVYPQFYIRQGGAFHIVLATAYLIEYYRTRSVTLLIFAKCCATVFLTSCSITYGEPWVLPFSAASDAAMGLCAFIVHRKAAGK
jgi:hypothetical protein